ncbi:class I SAM-dependent methyltransferase [Perlabentimonas gracilis]|uniref:class I SAM-dependent methyltransferase n=1 Tax=Perlabentimonas gracilis TaxID=2715279 RepID=UPI00140E2F54|nr:class I SAM-dependent methyltransferase [Perlabentimonas gracilis]NHB67715.1 class I SAM-dependent methyltransferase [Perlabentimonas gracilis]
MEKSLTSKGIFPNQWAFTLLFPLRKIFISPKQLIERMELEENHTVLELGPGPGFFSVPVAKILKKGKLVLADIQQEMLDYAKKRIERRKLTNVDFYLCNGKNFAFDDESFDRIFMVTVLGEVENQDEYIQEFYRMLKPSGILSVSEQAGDPDKMTAEQIRKLAERHNFSFCRVYGSRRNFTVNFKKRINII